MAEAMAQANCQEDGTGATIEQLLGLVAPYAPSPCQQALPLSPFSPANNQTNNKEMLNEFDKMVTLMRFQTVVAALSLLQAPSPVAPLVDESFLMDTRTPSLSPQLPLRVLDLPSPHTAPAAQLNKLPAPRMFYCDKCSFSTRYRGNLPPHLRQHAGVKPYACSVCQMAFTTPNSRNRHEKSQHGEGGAPKKNKGRRGANARAAVVDTVSPNPVEHDFFLDF
ncbi:hypothetical protein HDU77_011198 [Chytriomyces hyalinus]|nr:hypothetical protein HDU77_011198 [Chytriomyces hyalinus]